MTTSAVVVAALTAIAWVWWGVQRWIDLTRGDRHSDQPDEVPVGSDPPGA